MRKPTVPFTCLTVALAVSGCKNLAKVEVTLIDERTQLENQVLGAYEELNDDLALVASVRGVDEEGKTRVPPPASASQKRSLRAMQNREFNRDDIESFKREGAVGENKQGLLTFFETAKTEADAKHKAFVEAKVKEENEDRRAVMNRVIEVTPGLESKDLPEVGKIMAKRNRDSAAIGEKIQLQTGEWTVKTKR